MAGMTLSTITMRPEPGARGDLVSRLAALARETGSEPADLRDAVAEYERELDALRALIDEADASEEIDGEAMFDRMEAELEAMIATERQEGPSGASS